MRHQIVNLADGWAGTDLTVQHIARLVNESLLDPLVVTTARSLVRNIPDRDQDAEIAAVSQYVRSKIRYTNEGVETLSTPAYMISEINAHGRVAGDCDEAVILWASLLRSLGHRVRADVISQREDGIANHIYAQVFSKTRGWITDDTIVRSKPLGWEASKGVTAKKLYDLSGSSDEEVSGMGRFRIKRFRRFLAPVPPGIPLKPRRSRGLFGLENDMNSFQPGGTRRVDSAFFPPRRGWWARHVPANNPAWKAVAGVDLAVEDGMDGLGTSIMDAANALTQKIKAGGASLLNAAGISTAQGTPAPAAAKAGGSSMTTYVLIGGAALAAFFVLPKFLGKSR